MKYPLPMKILRVVMEDSEARKGVRILWWFTTGGFLDASTTGGGNSLLRCPTLAAGKGDFVGAKPWHEGTAMARRNKIYFISDETVREKRQNG